MKIIILFLAAFLAACSHHQTIENTTAANYNVQLGLGYLEKGDNIRAKEKLLRANQQAPDFVDGYLALAYYYEKIGQVQLAEQYYQKALKLEPKSGQVNNNYGAFLCKQGDYAKAISYFTLAMDDVYYHQSAKAYENAALCSVKLNDFTSAAKYADLAVQQDSSKQDLFLKLSYLLEQQGEKDQADLYIKRYHHTNSW